MRNDAHTYWNKEQREMAKEELRGCSDRFAQRRPAQAQEQKHHTDHRPWKRQWERTGDAFPECLQQEQKGEAAQAAHSELSMQVGECSLGTRPTRNDC